MKIVILDSYTVNPSDLSWADIENLAPTKIYERTNVNDEDEIVQRIGDAEIVITNKTPINKNVIERCPNIKFITLLSTGYDIVDGAYAREKNIAVSNVPRYGTKAVAQHAIALLLEITNRVGHHNETVKSGKWTNNDDFCYWDFPLVELADKTLGIIGFGQIGMQVGRIAKAIGMKVIALNPSHTDEGDAIADYVNLGELLEKSDIISLHCPQTHETEKLINKDSIAKMKDGVIIINNSRGGLIDEKDLANALNSGKVAAAAIDVVSTEPIKTTNPLLKAKNCYITPHISWASKECRQRIMDITQKNIVAFLNNNPINVVN